MRIKYDFGLGVISEGNMRGSACRLGNVEHLGK